MLSSQQKTLKLTRIIENNIESAIQSDKKSITTEYTSLLLKELEFEEQEANLKSNYNTEGNFQNQPLASSCRRLQGIIGALRKRQEELRDEINNLIIQSIAEQETFKIEAAEKEQSTKSLYVTEEERHAQEFDLINKECITIETELKSRIALEVSTKNARVNEIKGNLQRQMMERNFEYVKEQNASKDLRKELDGLKAELELENNRRSNIMTFEIGAVVAPNSKFLDSHIINVCSSVPEEPADKYDWLERDSICSDSHKQKQKSSNLKPNPLCLGIKFEKGFGVSEAKNEILQDVKLLNDAPKKDEDEVNVPRKLPTVYMGKIRKRKQAKN